MGFENWTNTTWGEVSELRYGRALKGYRNRTRGVPVFGTNGQIGYTDDPLTSGPGIIIGRKGAYRGVHYSKSNFFVIDTAYFLKINEEIIDIRWAYYELTSKDINSLDSGSAIPSTKREDFYALKVKIPPLKIQRKIVRILHGIDSKIDLNKQIILNLEQLAQTLFKRWFVDFEFQNENGEPYKSSGGEMVASKLGKIPVGWEIGKLTDFAELIMGQSPKSSTYNTEGMGLPLVNGASDFKDGIITPSKFTTDPKRITQKGDFLFGVRATVGNVTYVDKEYAIGRGAGATRVFDKKYKEFLYFNLISGINFLESTASGSVYINLTKKDIEDIKLVLPSEEVIIQFHNTISSLLNMKFNKYEENISLGSLRDTLLPKLLSGEIELPDETEVTENVPIS